MAKQWMTPDAIHVYRGKGKEHICTWCNWRIEVGQTYRRYAWRPADNRGDLIIMVEHYNERDCPWEEEERMDEEEFVHATAAVAIVHVLKEVCVVSLDVQGNPFTETKTIVETEARTEGSAETEPQEYFAVDGDDEIPF